ncbi:hypothetical protein BDR06DRAFT_898681 [Suillus hirtellus]|nr:hypothetical protein BDR06DRAFT_898681 [Suillus hirtellus]
MPIVVPPSTSNDVAATVPNPNQYDSDHAITVTTARDLYGIYQEYSHSIPSFNPDNFTSVAHISDAPTFAKSQDSAEARPWWSGFGKSIQSNQMQFFSPFLNATTFRLMQWFYGGSNMKSLAELDRLVDEVILADDFNKAHLVNFRAVKEANHLDSHQGDPQDVRSSFSAGDGWMETTVKIRLPADGVKHDSESMAPEFEVPGLFYQRPLEVIKAAFRETAAERFHLTPFKMFYQPSDDEPPERLSDALQDFYQGCFNKPATSEILTFCRHELMHAIWLLLMDDKFMHAYKFGIVIEFLDGVSRRVFPRFFTYSADYPEKTLLASIKFLAQCPCPRCLIPKTKIGGIGTKADQRWCENEIREDGNGLWSIIKRVREWLYVQGKNITSVHVKRMLALQSLVPTLNAFSTRLSHFGFNFYSMFVPDLLHEFELRVWKAVFIHLLRVLYAHGNDTIQSLNRRYRQIPTFGRGTIRKFSNNASGMKKLAAHDFEDLLKVSVYLYQLSDWCDLISHTTSVPFPFSRTFFQQQSIYAFTPTLHCPSSTHQQSGLAKFYAALSVKQRRSTTHMTCPKLTVGSSKRRRHFNFQTYKLHALGDYVNTIRQFGTTDNYSTMLGELEHRRVKRFYPRVSKSQFTSGIAKQQHCERILFRMAEHAQSVRSISTGHKKGEGKSRTWKKVSSDAPSLRFEDSEQLPFTDPRAHYHISTGVRHFVDIAQWLKKNVNDPAFTVNDHIISRLRGYDYDGDEISFTPAEHSHLIFINDRIYQHKVLRINYTSYDLRQTQDSLNPRTHADIMVLSHENDEGDAHPYWYAQIIGVFHAFVVFNDTATDTLSHESKQIDFVWVHWFGRDLEHRAGWRAKRLHRVGFIPSSDSGAFGFINPNQIIHGVHLIPAFTKGHTTDLPPPSIVRHLSENNKDWIYYYVNVFVDHDMFMRFHGGGMGHQTTREATQCFFHDRDSLDDIGPNSRGTRNGDDEIEEEEGEDNDKDGDEDGDEADEKENIDGDDDDIVDDELGAEDGENDDEELDGFDVF